MTEAGAGAEPSEQQLLDQGLTTSLYDHLKEETAKQHEPSTPGKPVPPLTSLQQQLAVGLINPYVPHSGLGPGLAHGFAPGMMHLKYLPHSPLRMSGALGGPLTRPLAGSGLGLSGPMSYKHGFSKLPHGMPFAMHSHRPGLSHGLAPSHMIRRPVMLPQQPRPLGGMLLSSPSQHNYVIKKPHFRVPGMSGVSLLSSTTLRPVYLTPGLSPGFASNSLHPSSLHTTLRPNIGPTMNPLLAQSLLAAQVQQMYTTKLQKLQAALSTSTTSAPTTTTTTPSPVPAPAPASSHHYPPHGAQSFPAYYRPPSQYRPSYTPVSPAFDNLEQSAAPLAINTGFNPGSVVVEGGFKPIIQRRQDVAEDRMAFIEGGDVEDDVMEGSVPEMERRSTDLDEEEEEDDRVGELSQQPEQSEQEQRTETFEPMFIPSPPDRNSFKPGAAKKASEPGKPPKALFLAKQGKRDKPAQLSPLIVRPRPSILRRPLYPNMVLPPFKIPARGHREKQPEDAEDELGPEQNADKDASNDAEDETMMAAERMDTYYLPPSPPAYAPAAISAPLQSRIVTYDGKPVDAAIAATIPKPPPDMIRSPSTADLVRGTPQFGPFLGEAPPPVPAAPSPLDLPQLHSPPAPEGQYSALPLSAPDGQGGLGLQLADYQADPLQTDASEQHDQRHKEKEVSAEDNHRQNSDADTQAEAARTRKRRSAEPRPEPGPGPHHEPGHEGHEDHEGTATAAGSAPGAASARIGGLASQTLSILCAIVVSAISLNSRL